MSLKKKRKASKTDPVVVSGETKIPTSTILAVVTAIFTGIGSLAAGQFHDDGLEVKIAKIEKDVEWIKWRLNGDERFPTERPKQPLTPEQQRPLRSFEPLLPPERRDSFSRE